MSNDNRPKDDKCECGQTMTWFGDHYVCVNIKLHDKFIQSRKKTRT